MDIYSIFCFVGAFLIIGLVLLASAIRLVPEYERLVVFRLGRCIGYRGPGIVVLLPTLDRAVKVDLREQKREVTGQQATTKEFLPVSIDYVWYFKVIDPVETVLQVGNIETAAQDVALAAFRMAISETESRALISEVVNIRKIVQTHLDDAAQKWGVKVTNLEIRNIAIDDRQKEIDKALTTKGTVGEAQTTVHTSGTVLMNGQAWEAISDYPIAPKTKVRVKRVVLEVEEDSSASSERI